MRFLPYFLPSLCRQAQHSPEGSGMPPYKLGSPPRLREGRAGAQRLRELPGPRRRWRMKWAGQHRSRAIGGPSRKQAREWHSRQGGQRWTNGVARPAAPLRHFVTPLPRDAASRLGRGKFAPSEKCNNGHAKRRSPNGLRLFVLALTYLSSPSPDKYFRHR